MSKSSNVFSTGQGGGVFEMNVQTTFLINMLIGRQYPGLPKGKAELIRFQAGSPPYNFATDDIYVELISDSGTPHKLLVQVKHNLAFTDKNEKFSEVIKAAWVDFNSENFDPATDQFLVVKGNLSDYEYNNVLPVLDWAKFKLSFADFNSELETSAKKKKVFEAFRIQLCKANNAQKISEEQLWKFLKCFNVSAYDFNLNNGKDKAGYLVMIERFLPDNSSENALSFWNKIFAFVSKANPKGASISYETLLKEMGEWIIPKNGINFYVNFYNGNSGNINIPLSYDYFYLDNELQKSFTEVFFKFKVVFENQSDNVLSFDSFSIKTLNYQKIDSRILRQNCVQGSFTPEKFSFLPIPFSRREVDLLQEEQLFNIEPRKSETIIFELKGKAVPGFYELVFIARGTLGNSPIELKSKVLPLMVSDKNANRLKLETWRFYDTPVETILYLEQNKWNRLKAEVKKGKYELYLGQTPPEIDQKVLIPAGSNWKIKGVKKIDVDETGYSIRANAQSKVFVDLGIPIGEQLFELDEEHKQMIEFVKYQNPLSLFTKQRG